MKPESKRCGLGRLLLIMVYDGVIMIGVLIAAAALVSPFDQGNQQAFRDPLFTVYLAVSWFMYLAICWRKAGMTVGMRAWRVRIQSPDGKRPTWSQCVTRFLVSLVSAIAAGAGFWGMLLDIERRSWHDRASNTGLFRTDFSD